MRSHSFERNGNGPQTNHHNNNAVRQEQRCISIIMYIHHWPTGANSHVSRACCLHRVQCMSTGHDTSQLPAELVMLPVDVAYLSHGCCCCCCCWCCRLAQLIAQYGAVQCTRRGKLVVGMLNVGVILDVVGGDGLADVGALLLLVLLLVVFFSPDV